MAIQNQPGFIPAPFANSGTKNVIPETMPTPSASAAASWTDGFPAVCSLPLASGGIPPARADFNGLFNSITQAQAFYQSGGVYGWDATIDYGPNRLILGSDGRLYWSMAQSGPNTGAGAVDPTTDDGTYWGALPATTSGTAAEADALATPRKIDGVAFDGTSDIVHFGECSTAGSTAEKTVSCPGFALQAGARIAVRFQNENIASSLLLNVESTGAKAVYAHGAAVSSGIFKAGCVYDFVYDGAQYQLLNNGDSTPTGTILWLSTPTVPAGYLLCNGSAVGRATYPELFTAIGTTYGAGDGSTTFNLPNLIDKFAEGSTVAGTVKNAGLPNITGTQDMVSCCVNTNYPHPGALFWGDTNTDISSSFTGPAQSYQIKFDASRSSSVYGASNTVQPPALTLLPCIKAFSSVVGDATVVAGQLVNDIQSKVALDGSNASAIGKTLSTYMAHVAMPNNASTIAITLPYTAPADGYIAVDLYANPSKPSTVIFSDSIQCVGIHWDGVSNTVGEVDIFPVSKGAEITINGSGITSISFIYANGTTP